MSRRKDRRKRIVQSIRHYLYAHRYGEWVSNHDIVRFLDYSSRGKNSYNSISTITLGQYIRGEQDIIQSIRDVNGRKCVCYKLVVGEEE